VRFLFLFSSFLILNFDRPANKEELFNLRHASARNVVSQTVDILKQRFRILLSSSEYDINIQARIPVALCAIHNFIRSHDPDDEGTLPEGNFSSDDENHACHQGQVTTVTAGDSQELDDANMMRDHIAKAMWDDYQHAILSETNVSNSEELSDTETDSEDDSYP